MTLDNRKENTNVPNVAFKIRKNNGWAVRTSQDIFDKKNVIVFSLPGAFTPTCSSTHVPRYNELHSVFKQLGIDEIVCMSVNDPFVMQAWAEDQEAENISFLSDGNGEFTRQMGMLVDKAELNFGHRSWRYAMLVRDGKIEKMFVEPQKDGDPFEVSDADTMREYLDPTHKVAVPKDVVLFTKKGCNFCVTAKNALTAAGIGFEEIVLPNANRGKVLRAVSKEATAPQMFVDGQLISGSDAIVIWTTQHA